MAAVAMSPKAGAHGELCGMMAIKAALAARGETRTDRARAGIGARHQPGDRCAARLQGGRRAGARRRHRRSGSGEGKRLGADVAGDHADQPQHLRPVRARHRRDRRGGPRRRRLFLCRRRQLQRHRRQGAAGRSRRRRHAHQPAQDLLDAARRRRAGRRPGGAVGGAGAVRAGALRAHGRGGADSGRDPCRHEGRRPSRSAGITAFHGQMGMFVRALAYMLAHGADGMRQASEDAVLNANYVRAGLARRYEPALRRPHLHARGSVRRQLPRRDRRHARSISPRR